MIDSMIFFFFYPNDDMLLKVYMYILVQDVIDSIYIYAYIFLSYIYIY